MGSCCAAGKRHCLDQPSAHRFPHSGIVIFRNEVATFVSEERHLNETDSPCLAPVPHRGKRNEPAFVADVAKRLADLRGCAVESLANATTENAWHLFGLSEEKS